MMAESKESQMDLLQGTLHLLLLKSLALGEMHGLGIARRIEQLTRGTFQVKPGSLFPALQRMKENGWVTSSVGKSETNRDAKYYRLTRAGRKQLESETEQWERLSAAIGWLLQAG
jgi:PadR family transcriptional regulator, regulatory protein PadR